MDIFSYLANEHRDKWKDSEILRNLCRDLGMNIFIFKKIKIFFLNYIIEEKYFFSREDAQEKIEYFA